MINPSEADKGRLVAYIPNHVEQLHAGQRDHPDVELGFIASFNPRVVWVHYAGDLRPKATCRENLEWIFHRYSRRKEAQELVPPASTFAEMYA